MNSINLIKLLIIFAIIVQNNSSELETQLCVDERCEEIISLARTVKNYAPNQVGLLSFKANLEVKIKSKSSSSDYWGAEINGKFGYVPKIFIREQKIYHKIDTLKSVIPKIQPPKSRSNKKLKASEKQEPAKAIETPTDPLAKDLEKEKIILNKVEGNQISNEIPVNITPTAKVIDGSEIPKKVPENDGQTLESENINEIFENNDFIVIQNEEDENDVDDDEDEEEEEGEDASKPKVENNTTQAIESTGSKPENVVINPSAENSKPSLASETNLLANASLETVQNATTPSVESSKDSVNSSTEALPITKDQELVKEISKDSINNSAEVLPNTKDQEVIVEEALKDSINSSSNVLPNTKDQTEGVMEISKDSNSNSSEALPNTQDHEELVKEISKDSINNSAEVLPNTKDQEVIVEEALKDSINSSSDVLPNTKDQTEGVMEISKDSNSNSSEALPNTQDQEKLVKEKGKIIIKEDGTKIKLLNNSKEQPLKPSVIKNEEIPESVVPSVQPLQPIESPTADKPLMDQPVIPSAPLPPIKATSAGKPLMHQAEIPSPSLLATESTTPEKPLMDQPEIPSAPLPQLVTSSAEKPQIPSASAPVLQPINPTTNLYGQQTETQLFNTPVADSPAPIHAPQGIVSSEGIQQQFTPTEAPFTTYYTASSLMNEDTNTLPEEATPVIPDIAFTTPMQDSIQNDSPFSGHQHTYDHNTITPSPETPSYVTTRPIHHYNNINNFHYQGAGGSPRRTAVNPQIDLPTLKTQIMGTPQESVSTQPSSTVETSEKKPDSDQEVQTNQQPLEVPVPKEVEKVPEQLPPAYISEPIQDQPIEENINHQSANNINPSEIPQNTAPEPEHPISAEPETDPNAITNDSQTEQVTSPVPTTPVEVEELIPDPIDYYITTDNPKAAPKVQPELGLFQTILGTVKGFLPSQDSSKEGEFSNELDRILFPKKESDALQSPSIPLGEEFCEKEINCPKSDSLQSEEPLADQDFFENLSQKIVEMFDVLCCMLISAIATLLFTFGYYCLSQCRKESQLIAKLNVVERSLLASHKESAILKHDLSETCDKLASIENNSFGSNDMVMALKKDLEICEEDKAKLEKQIVSLEKELENAAEAGLELNKIVSELLNNQTGDESIISSVEELQRQLNEQQNTILEINAVLADKSRENSELQLMLAEQNAKFVGEIASLQQDNDELEGEKNILNAKLEEMKAEFDLDITKALEGKNSEIKRLQADIMGLREKCDDEHRKWQTSVAKIEALENCLKSVKRDPSIKISQLLDVANVQAELLDTQRQKTAMSEKLDVETDARKLLEAQVKSFSDEIGKLKQDFNQSEKDKLEAQTRLEVLSNYFKEKETQLQKELSLKETLWLQQQGETTSTVDRLTNMRDEIQTLKSQNDSLRAEIEAQLAAHKAQIGTLENRAHESWLAARQSERRCEEARSDATALRRKLTSLVGTNPHNLPKENNLDLNLPPADPNAPSPIHMDSPASPMLGRMPPPFMPPPGLGPPPPPRFMEFMGMPPFYMPQGKIRPPPMSPPPPPGGPHLHRYSPIDVDDDDEDIHDNDRGHWRDSYSPPRHSYRYSPDRYDYDPVHFIPQSHYDTETDFSPPPSPRDRSHRSGSRPSSYKAYSPPPQPASSQTKDRPMKSNKGRLSSGSEKSYDSWKGKSRAMV